MAAAHASVHHVPPPHYANHPSAVFGTLPSIRDLDLGIQPQSQPQQQQPPREQLTQNSPVYAQRPQYGHQQSVPAPVMRQDQWARPPMSAVPQQPSPLSQLPPHHSGPQYNAHVPLTPESAPPQRSMYERNAPPYPEQPPLKRPRPNSRSGHAGYPPPQQMHAQSSQVFQYPQPPQSQPQQQQHMHAHAMQPPPPPVTSSLPPTPTDIHAHSQHAAFAPAPPTTAYPTPSPTQPTPPQYFHRGSILEYPQRSEFAVPPTPQHTAPPPQLHQLRHQAQSQPQLPSQQQQQQQQHLPPQHYAQNQHPQQQPQQSQMHHHQPQPSQQPHPPPPPPQQQQQPQQQHSRPLYAPQPWQPQSAPPSASQHVQQQPVHSQPMASISPSHHVPPSHSLPHSHHQAATSTYQPAPAQQHLQMHHPSPAPQSPLYPYSMQQQQQQPPPPPPPPQHQPQQHQSQPPLHQSQQPQHQSQQPQQQQPQQQPQQAHYQVHQHQQQPAPANPAPYAPKSVAPPDLHIQVPRPPPVSQPPPQQMQVPVQTLLAPEPPAAMSVSPVEIMHKLPDPIPSPAVNELQRHCTSLYQFASHYAAETNSFPSDEEFAEMNKLAERVVRLLKDLQHQSQPSASTPTFPHPMEDVQSTLESGSSTQSTEQPRPPKRPWEDTSIPPPPTSSFGENGGQPIALPESQTTAEADMELIRNKRATTTGSATGSAKEKIKYRKRSRANPPGKCHSCGIRETPEWRRGPDGARTLCNACGLHYAKLVRKRDKAAAANGSSPPAIDIATLRASARANGSIGSAPPSPQDESQPSSQGQQDEPPASAPPSLPAPSEMKPPVSQQQQQRQPPPPTPTSTSSYPPPVMPALSGPAAAPGGWARAYPPPVQAHVSAPILALPQRK